MERPTLSALLVDPGLFTAPYDAALSGGLEAAGVAVTWATRPFRTGEAEEMNGLRLERIYYRGVAESVKHGGAGVKLRKAASHALGGLRLRRLAQRFDVVHVQWPVVPLYDAWLMRGINRRIPVILTVHDLQAFNGDPSSQLQSVGFDGALRAARRLIVHSDAARETLIARGFDPAVVFTIPHGPLALRGVRPAPDAPRQPRAAGQPWRIVLFGKLQPYKGADILIEAVGRLSPETRTGLEVVIAGEPLTPPQPLIDRAAALGVESSIVFQLRRHSEDEMAELFAGADAFVFPYRQIEASGVLHLVAPYRQWMIASDLGAFKAAITPGINGERVPADDAGRLADALAASIGRRPTADPASVGVGWDEIGRRTRAVYEDALAGGRAAAAR